MSIERIVLIATWASTAILLLLFVPKMRRRDAIVVFLLGQVLTWALSQLFVELHWVKNPVREFPKASGTNFTFNYAFYPTFNVIYSLYYPRKKAAWKKIAFAILLPAASIPFFYCVDKYTDLMQLVKMKWYSGYLVLAVGSYFVHRYYQWFIRRFRKEYGL